MCSLPAISYAHDHRERFLQDLQELLRIPSVSTLPEHRPDMERAANWLVARLNDVGIQAEIILGQGHPLVYGEWLHAPGAPTVLVYGHYDVQPVDPIDLWESDPFEPEVRNGNVYARGASDDKGQTLTFLYAAESLLRTHGALPLNLKFLIEGEEECGGAAIKAYVAGHGDRLQADVVQVADSHMFAPGVPTLETGLRGIVYTEVLARGAGHDLHSGLYGGVAPNPLNALAMVIANLKDESGRILIPGFYDDIMMPNEEVRASWRSLPFDQAAFMAEAGLSALPGEQGYSALERMWSRPTFDVHGIVGGFIGKGAKTVIPAEATAKISMRLVPGQLAATIFEAFKSRVEDLAPPGIELRVRLVHGDDPVLISVESPFVQVARESLQETFGQDAVLGRSGGSIPIVGVFKESLGMDSLLMGWGLPDDNLHAPNEKFALENYYLGIDTTIRFWSALGGLP